jgi:[ribosomal protein S18]-alanine N-acetyltransferase
MNAMEMVIERVSAPEDLDAVAALEEASFTNPWTRAMLERELRQSAVTRVHVLRLPGQRVAAFCASWLVYDELHINTIAVHPDLRRRGLATVLMQHVFAEAVRQGAERAFLEVRRSNVPAQRLYEALGFRVAGLRPKYYSHPEEDAIVLVREGLPVTPDRVQE